MNAETKICSGEGVVFFRFWHPYHDEHVDPRQERSEITSLNFLDSGQFSLKIGLYEWDMDHSQCFITRPGLVFRSKHRQALPRDVFFSVQFDESIVDEALLIAGKPHARSGTVALSRFGIERANSQIRGGTSAGGGKLISLKFDRTEIQVYGDVAVLYSLFTLETEEGSKRKRSSGRATEIFRRNGDTWVNTGWHLDSGA